MTTPTHIPTPHRRSFDRADIAWCGAIFVLALVLRVIYVMQVRHYPFFDLPQMDAAFHDEWARAILAGKAFGAGAYFRAPLYPWFLAGLYSLSDCSLFFARIAQAAVGSIGCVMAYVLARVAFSRPAAILAGFAAATYWIFIYFDAELLIPVLLVPLDLLLLTLLIIAIRRRRFAWWLAAGLVMGLSAIARPNILLLAPVLVGWILLTHRRTIRPGLLASFALFLGTIAPIAPITIRNYAVGHDLALIATQAGVNLYIGNNPGADGMSAVIPGDPAEWWPCFQAQVDRAERAEGRRLKGSEVSQWYARQTRNFIASEPAAAASLVLRKLLYFWSRWEVSNNQDIYFVASKYAPVTRWLPISFAIVAPLGLLGLILTLRRSELFPLWGFVIVYMASVVAFFVTARYRIPVVAVLIVLAAHAVCWVVSAARRREWKRLAAGLLPVAIMIPIVAQVPPGVDRGQIQGHRSVGLYLVDLGRFAEARPLLEHAASAAVGTVFEREERMFAALARARRETGDQEGAITAYERAAEGSKHPARYWLEVGRLEADRGQLIPARETLRRAIQAEPRLADAQIELGIVEAVRDDAQGAASLLREAAALDPTSLLTVLERIAALRESGRGAEALRIANAGWIAAPADPRFAVVLLEILTSEDAAVRDLDSAIAIADAAVARSQRQDPRVLLAAARAYAAAGKADEAIALLSEARSRAAAGGGAALVGEIEVEQQRLHSPPAP